MDEELIVLLPHQVLPHDGAYGMRQLLSLREPPTAGSSADTVAGEAMSAVHDGIRHLLSLRRPPTAVLCTDTLATEAMSAVRQAGLDVPADVAFIGIGDEPASTFQQPPLSSLRLPYRRKAVLAAELVIDLVEGQKTEPEHLLLEPELILRDSCPPRAPAKGGQAPGQSSRSLVSRVGD